MAAFKYSIFLIFLAGGQLATISASGSNQNPNERNRRKLHNHGNNHASHPPPPPITVHMPVHSPTFHEHGGAGVYSQSNLGYGYHAPVPSIRDYIDEGSGDYGKAESNYGHPDQRYDVPTPYPTHKPNPYPTNKPYPEHHPYPTDKPYPAHNPYPTHKPYSKYHPTYEPTESSEPSEEPTESQEPSENPTASDEPSENPTESLEPSELPTQSEEPTQNARLNIFEFICDDANVNTFGTLCAVVSTSPAIRGILDNSAFVDVSSITDIPGFDPSVLRTVLPNYHQPRVSRIDIPGFQRRNLERSPLTLFAPNNDAMNRLLQRSINDFFDPDDDEAIEFFEGINIDISDDNEILGDFLLSDDGRIVLDEIILTHIFNEELLFDMLTCENMITMVSGDITVTDCIPVTVNGDRAKFQIGLKNTEFDQPRIIRADVLASNGVVHEVNEVILPEIDCPVTGGHGIQVISPFSSFGIIITQDPTQSP